MSNHTLGPWEVVRELDDSLVIRTESPKKTSYGASRYAVIGGYERHDPEQFGEALAIARLIAAAPDLLEALKRALPELEYMASGMTHAAWKTMEAKEALDLIQAAIAKAGGAA